MFSRNSSYHSNIMRCVKYAFFISGLIGYLSTVNVLADTVYKSTDAAGVVTYSQEPPAASASVEPVRIAPAPSAETTRAAQEEVQRTVQRADRLVEQRRAYNQKLFEEMEKTRREAQKRAAEQQRYQIQYRSGYPYYYSRPRRPYWKPRPPQYRPPSPPVGRLAMPRAVN